MKNMNKIKWCCICGREIIPARDEEMNRIRHFEEEGECCSVCNAAGAMPARIRERHGERWALAVDAAS